MSRFKDLDKNSMNKHNNIARSNSSTESEESVLSSSEYDLNEFTDNDVIENISSAVSEDDEYIPPKPKKIKYIDENHNQIVKKAKKYHSRNSSDKKELDSVILNEKTQNPITVACKDLVKGTHKYSHIYNISVPKSSNKLVINLKRRNLKTLTLHCLFGEQNTIVHQSEEAIITSST